MDHETKSSAAGKALQGDSVDRSIYDLPAGVPKPHAARDWGKWLEKEQIARGLTDVARGKFTPGLFPVKWSRKALDPVPDLPEGASWADKMKHQAACVELEKRVAFNKRLADQKETWWRDKLNEYFTVLTSSMERTQPGLREVLRDRYHMGDGYYDGVAAYEFVTQWIKNALRDSPQNAYYERMHALVETKRLPVGCSDREFCAVARRWAFDINPFVRAPYANEAFGKFIIEKIMPPYSDAADRLVDELRDAGTLHEYETVVEKCSAVVSRRATKAAAAAPMVAELEMMFAESEAKASPELPEDVEGMPFQQNKPKKAIDPKRGVFCPGCPHKSRDGRALECLSDPRKKFDGHLRILRRIAAKDPGLVKLAEVRNERAKVLGITAVPLPEIKKSLGDGGGGGGKPTNIALVDLVELVALVEREEDYEELMFEESIQKLERSISPSYGSEQQR